MPPLSVDELRDAIVHLDAAGAIACFDTLENKEPVLRRRIFILGWRHMAAKAQ